MAYTVAHMRTHNEIPADPLERAAWVIYQLKARRKSLASIAREGGWDRGTVRRALFQPSFPQEQALAQALGMKGATLFPERYDARGRRLHYVRKPRGEAA